jgi:transcriptional regulator with XRE-family HTH domain
MPKSKGTHVLVRVRRHLSLTQEQLAKWCGCSYYTIQAVELGRLNLSPSLAERISLVTGVPAKYLLENNPSAPFPKLIWAQTEPGTFINSFNSQTLLFMAVARALDAIERAKGTEELQLVDYQCLKFRAELDKAFGQSEMTGGHEGLADYLQARLDSYRNPSAEEIRRAQAAREHVKTYITPLLGGLAETLTRQEKKGKKQSARPQKKAPRRIRQSA